jgi:hypothetical protein
MTAHSDKGDVTEVATVALTEEQKALIAKATGVSVNELSVLKVTGAGARQLNPALLEGLAVVACW